MARSMRASARSTLDLVEESGVCHVVFEDSPVDGREGFDRDKEVGSGGQPLGAVFGETATWDDVVDMGMVLELSAPGMEDTGKTGELRTDEALLFGEAFDGLRRGFEQGLVGDVLMRTDKWAQGLRDSEGDEEVGSWELFFKLVMEPLLGFMMLTLRTMAVAA